MEYAALFFLLIFLLFFLSRSLTSEIYSFLYKVAGSETFSTNFIALVFFPGVFMHEISHYLSAQFLFVPTGKISFFPKKEGGYLRLGSVSVAHSNIVKEFLIGVAPLIVGIITILFIVYFFLQNEEFTLLRVGLSLYAIFVVSNTMYASRRDFQAALPFLISIILIGVIMIFLGVRFPVVDLEWIPDINLGKIFYIGSVYLVIPIVIDLVIILMLRIFNRMW